jgi:hypothetical protein
LTLPALSREDYPDVKFWTKRQWNEASADALVDVTLGPQVRGRTRAAQGINVKMRYVEQRDGTIIDGDRASEIRKFARAIWVSIAKRGPLPPKWGQADVETRRQYCNGMASRFLELRLCEHEWKAEQIATNNYPSWYVNQQASEEKQMKQDDGELASQETGTKRAHIRSKKYSSKKTKIEPAVIENAVQGDSETNQAAVSTFLSLTYLTVDASTCCTDQKSSNSQRPPRIPANLYRVAHQSTSIPDQ